MKILIISIFLCILSTVFGLPPAVLRTAYEFCYSKNDEEGRCVGFDECYPYMKLLSERPILKSHLRLVVNLTCTFDLENPLICCPLEDILMTSNSLHYRKIVYPSDFDQRSRLSKEKLRTFTYHQNFHLLPSTTECSIQKGNDHSFGSGQKISQENFPFLGLLGYENSQSKSTDFLCGASVISKRYLLTSAKCVHNEGLRPYMVRLGDHDLNSPDCSDSMRKNRLECSKDLMIDKIISHPRYNYTDSYFQSHDIALVRLSQDIPFNEHIQPVCLPFVESEDLDNVTVSLSAGWGKHLSGGQGSTVLRHVIQSIKSNEKCTAFYSLQQPHSEMTENQICTVGACGANRGGPLLTLLDQKFKASKLFQIGVTSFGPCTQGIPSVHTKVSSYLQWILDSMEP